MNDVAMARELADLLLPSPNQNPVQLIQGIVSSVQLGTVTLQLGAAPYPISKIKYLSSYSKPKAGDSVWVLKNGPDLLILGTLNVTGLNLLPWTDFTLSAPWVAYGGGWPAPAYYKDNEGWVHLSGLARTTAGTGIGTSVATLPVGFRPWINAHFPVLANDTASYFDVTPAGLINFAGPGNGNGWCCLDGISFPSFGASYEGMIESISPVSPKWAAAVPLDIPNGRWLGFCQPRWDGLIRGFGAAGAFTAGGIQGYLPDMLTGRWTELHSVFGFSGGVNDPARFDVMMSHGRIEMTDIVFGASSQINITGRQFWPVQSETGWINATLQNGWANWNGTFTKARYRKDLYGVVHLSGLLNGGAGTLASGTTILTLPEGYRPLRNSIWHCVNGTGVTRLDMRSDGTLKIASMPISGTYTSIEDIRFRTDS